MKYKTAQIVLNRMYNEIRLEKKWLCVIYNIYYDKQQIMIN